MPDTVQAEYISTMGPELGRLYHALWNEVAWVHAKWNQYRQLFAKDAETIDVLNRTGAFFFRVVQDVLWEDTLLHIARLTDPPGSGQRENLTITRFEVLISDVKVRLEVQVLIALALEKAAFARAWRNKHLAHRDLARALQQSAETLPPASRQMVQEALNAIADVMNALEGHYRNTEVHFEGFIGSQEAESLVFYLELAVEAEDRRRERIREGRPLPEDFPRPRRREPPE
jgi:AbiU2